MENGTNFIEVGGRVQADLVFSHEIYGEGFYRFDVEVDRLSGTADALPVTVSERIIDRGAMKPGQLVLIRGQIRSYNNYVEADRKNKLVLTVFARDIELLDKPVDPSPNDVFLNGYLCKPPIYRTTPFGREIADLLVAVNRSYNKSDYIPCIAWGRNARYAGRLTVGDNIRLWGRMQSRQYQKRKDDGEVQEKTAYEVSTAKIEVILPEDELVSGEE
ncbi:MAG: single-stranded DNA-binding protein [Defluviitaleaceae bacterium]|nr:single-stranded DNA-binding protein [Defluviitaleaceae bacterium]